MPDALVDVTLMDRFHWTLTELDEQDESRLIPAVAAANIHAALARVSAWQTAAVRGKVALPSDADLAVWGDVQRMLKENP